MPENMILKMMSRCLGPIWVLCDLMKAFVGRTVITNKSFLPVELRVCGTFFLFFLLWIQNVTMKHEGVIQKRLTLYSV